MTVNTENLDNYTIRLLEKLPEWFKSTLPENFVEPNTIKYDAEKQNFLVYEDDSLIGEFKTVALAYDYSKDHRGRDVIFDDSMFNNNSETFDGNMDYIFENSGDKGFKRLLTGKSYKTELEHFVYLFENFEKISEDYLNDPDNFEKAWNFVNAHPTFWVKYDKDSVWNRWNYNGYTTRIVFYPMFNDDGSVGWFLEGGSHVAPDYINNYYDYRLDASADSFENAIIVFADLVNTCFNPDGSEKDVVDEKFVKPSYIVEAEKRCNDFLKNRD